MENSKLPEAPVSLTFKVAYKGIEVLATKRDEDIQIKPFLESAKVAIDWALANGFEVPQKWGKNATTKPVETVPDRKCPTCTSPLIYAYKKDGTKFIKCSTNKYVNGQATGCSYVSWKINEIEGSVI